MDQEMLILLPDQSLTFSSADHFKYKIIKYVVQNTPKVIVIDGRYVRTIDATVAKVRLWERERMSFNRNSNDSFII